MTIFVDIRADPNSRLLITSTLSTAAFWKRVDSFSSYGWFGKPLAVSPLECARFGWKLHSADTLGCTFCKKQLIYSNSDPAQLVSYTLKYIELLQSAHNDECPFKTKAISQAVYSLQTRPSSVIVSRFYERLYLLHKALPQQPQITEGELNLEVQELLKYGVRSPLLFVPLRKPALYQVLTALLILRIQMA